MACQFNAKFSFDNAVCQSYEEVTAPLRLLLQTDIRFRWNTNEENAYKKLMEVMNDPDRQTHVTADASEGDMQGSIYQEKKNGKEWIPIDHTTLTNITSFKNTSHGQA